jgi:hypothetical protein
MSIVVKEVVDSSVGLQDTEAVHIHQFFLFIESLGILSLSEVSGDVWESWAFNGQTFEPSVYSGYNFNSYLVADGVTYAARAEGIYIIGGSSDAGVVIHPGVILSPSIFGKMNQKRFRQGFFDVTGTAPLVRGEVGGRGVSLPIVARKAVFPRELAGAQWTFLIADFDTLGKVELYPIMLTR